uniref:Fc receptor-like protein 5 n=1 Tax=Semicossyphus pulcher TaxID=241346 RepID=UPI0037E99198
MVSSEDSNYVTIHKLVSNRPVVVLQPNWTEIFKGEKKTLRCEIHGVERTEWMYEWMTPNLNTSSRSNEYEIGNAVSSHNGDYWCKGRHREDPFSSTDLSEAITLTFPRVHISADKPGIPAGGNVILNCTVNPSSPGWKYSWFRGNNPSPVPMNPQDAVVLSSQQISVSQGGRYRCRGGRGNPVYYTEYTNYIDLNKFVTNKAVVTIQPKWHKIYKGEHITLTCEIEDGENNDWEYEWRSPGYVRLLSQHENLLTAYPERNGDYACFGKKAGEHTTTERSGNLRLRVYDYTPRPVLTVSPLWLSPRDSVTLNCQIEHPSEGWRFYWYKAVPKSGKSYSYELLPGSSSGTAHNSYTVYGQTYTAGYVCRAERGNLIYYTLYSDPKFAWSGDFQSASLTVSPDRVQHFITDSVTLSCEGNSAKWRVRSSNTQGSDCETMTGATCNIPKLKEGNTVYWCESGSGEFSNAVNISADKKNMILVSPVHPVTEGDSFTLGCKLKTGRLDCPMIFYRDNNIIGKDTGEEFNISAASKSDEGFYKCKCGKIQSPQSWVAVKCEIKQDRGSFGNGPRPVFSSGPLARLFGPHQCFTPPKRSAPRGQTLQGSVQSD